MSAAEKKILLICAGAIPIKRGVNRHSKTYLMIYISSI